MLIEKLRINICKNLVNLKLAFLLFLSLVFLNGCQRQPTSNLTFSQTVECSRLEKKFPEYKFSINCRSFVPSSLTISLPAGGVVSYVASNKQVKKGELIIRLKTEDLESLLDQTKQLLSFERDKLQRLEKLKQVNGISTVDYLAQKTIVSNLELKIEELGKQLADRSFSAPEDGVVGPILVKAGESIKPFQVIGTFQGLSQNFIDCKLLSKYYQLAKAGNFVASLEGETLALQSISTNIEDSDTFLLRLKASRSLLSNESFTVQFQFQEQSKELVVPLEAIKLDLSGFRIFKVAENDQNKQIARAVYVQVKKLLGESAVISGDGLEEGTLYVTKGAQKLFDGVELSGCVN